MNYLNPDCNFIETIKLMENSGMRQYSLSFTDNNIYQLTKYLEDSEYERDIRLAYKLYNILDTFKELNSSNTIHGITISFGKYGTRELFFKVNYINQELDSDLYDIEKAMVEKMWFQYISNVIIASELHEVYSNNNWVLGDVPVLNDNNVMFRVWYDKE